MQRKIEIYEQDAYRAKTEGSFHSGIFFEDVYKRADAIVCDIIEQMQIYTQDSQKQGGHKTKYHGMGNNIICFCADRGQGKTSAMQSYAAYLQDRTLADKNFFCEDNVISKCCFKVLDPIDPSSLDNGESIIKVFVSRLFLEISKIVDNDNLSLRDEIKFRKEKDDILKAFQQCYENIDYLQKERKIEAYDLEAIAQLGNSAELKKNLYGLVNYFLEIFLDDKKGMPYLVLQIDDADLSMGDIFKICDDIRNYFSIPNMIVMMATNYSQLELAICQRYMKQYENIICFQRMRNYEEECNRMAFRYLEKMLPAGHRVILPAVDVLINENANSLRVLYYKRVKEVYDKTIEPTEMFETVVESNREENRCRNLEQQLIKLLYLKTGIVLLEYPGEMHPILPHTLRELTHFIKLLDDMENIDQQEAFRVRAGLGSIIEVEKWKNNLDILKRYFLNYWCGTHLLSDQQKLIEEIDQANRKMDFVCQSISRYIEYYEKKDVDALKAKSVTYRNVMKELVENGLEKWPVLQNAVFFYYTIVLNEWFIRGIEDVEQLKALAEFIEKPLDVEELIDNEKYSILQFEFKAEDMRQYAGGELENVLNSAWLTMFCTEASDHAAIDENRVIKILSDKSMPKQETEELKFDIFRPIFTMIFSDMWINKENNKNENDDTASVDDDANFRSEENMSVDMSYLISVKNLIANVDVQRWAQKRIQRKISDSGDAGERRLDRIWKEYYELIDSWVEKRAYLEEKSILEKMCFGKNLENPTIGNLVFLSNDKNRAKYLQEYESYINGCWDMLREKLVEIEKISVDDETIEIAVKQMIGDITSYSFTGSVILPMDDKKSNNQFLQRIPVLNDLTDTIQKMEQTIESICRQLAKAIESNMTVEQIRTQIKNIQTQTT